MAVVGFGQLGVRHETQGTADSPDSTQYDFEPAQRVRTARFALAGQTVCLQLWGEVLLAQTADEHPVWVSKSERAAFQEQP